MSRALDDIVKININRETKAVAVSSFGTIAIISEFLETKTTSQFERFAYYANTSEMLEDGWASTDAEYQMASAVFAQSPSVDKIMIGRKDSGDADWTEALNAIQVLTQDWYGVLVNEDNQEDLEAIAEWVEGQVKMLIIQDDDPDTLDSVETSTAAKLKAKSYERTAVIFHDAGTNEQAHAAWLGECLPHEPGSQTWAFKTLKGITPDALTGGEQGNAFKNGANTYTVMAGVGITEKGQMVGGEWIDIIRGCDWIKARMQERIFLELVNKRKIPYDDGGILLIESYVRAVLGEAVAKGILQDGSVEVDVPKYADIPKSDRIGRHLPDIKWNALLQGAIQKIEITGTVTV